MGEALDRDGHVLGHAFGDTKREVFDKLISEFKDAAEIRIKTIESFQARERFEAENGGTDTPMPQYQSHKKVWALKIKDVLDPSEAHDRDSDGTRILVFERPMFGPMRVPAEYVRKHNPKAGGYYVQYEGGYASWSPADAFESGYTEMR